MRNEVDSGQILKDSNEFGFYPKGDRDSLKNFKQGFNTIQFVIYPDHSGSRVGYIPVLSTFLNIILSFNPHNCPVLQDKYYCHFSE